MQEQQEASTKVGQSSSAKTNVPTRARGASLPARLYEVTPSIVLRRTQSVASTMCVPAETPFDKSPIVYIKQEPESDHTPEKVSTVGSGTEKDPIHLLEDMTLNTPRSAQTKAMPPTSSSSKSVRKQLFKSTPTASKQPQKRAANPDSPAKGQPKTRRQKIDDTDGVGRRQKKSQMRATSHMSENYQMKKQYQIRISLTPKYVKPSHARLSSSLLSILYSWYSFGRVYCSRHDAN